ncbi:hypothetical protein AGMMS50268_02200 [Spirochaetia bacterium]|nr:hypothetical protein AGMMS50268_02200 [Spirochaetia bacterium]
MSDAELLLKEIEGLPPDYVAQIFDFVDQLKHKALPLEQKESRGKKPPLAQTTEALWELCKDASLTVDSFIEERHAETEREINPQRQSQLSIS